MDLVKIGRYQLSQDRDHSISTTEFASKTNCPRAECDKSYLILINAVPQWNNKISELWFVIHSMMDDHTGQ